MIVPRQASTFDLALNDGKFQAAVLGRQLLMWWQFHGRKDPSLKPWMFTADGRWPAPDEALNPYPIHVVEVMRAARRHMLNELHQLIASYLWIKICISLRNLDMFWYGSTPLFSLLWFIRFLLDSPGSASGSESG